MESQVFDMVRMEKEKAVARFNQFRRLARLRHVLEVFAVLGLLSWSSARVPAVTKAAARFLVDASNYLLNHHVVFVVGNAIIVLLFVLCRGNDAVSISPDGADFYGDYVKHREAANRTDPARMDTAARDPPAEIHGGDEERRIAVCTEEIPQCDDVAAAIEKAARQIKRFQRTQSEKLKRDIAVRPLRRSETRSRVKKVVSGEGFEDMERLSSEEFRRTVDAFIDKHWIRKETKKQNENQFEGNEKYHQLLKMA